MTAFVLVEACAVLEVLVLQGDSVEQLERRARGQFLSVAMDARACENVMRPKLIKANRALASEPLQGRDRRAAPVVASLPARGRSLATRARTMDEPSPWGAPASDDLPALAPHPSSPRRSTYSPPPAASSSFSAPAWPDDDGGDGGWGGAVDDYVPGAFGGGFSSASGGGGFTSDSPHDDDGVALSHSNGAARGWHPDSPELPKLVASTSSAPIADAASPSSLSGFRPSPPLSPAALALPSFPPDSLDASTARDDERASEGDDGRGWGGAEPDLPPLGALRIAAPESPAADDSRDDGWGPAQEGPDPDDKEPPLPSLGDLFPSAAASRRQSVELAQKGEQGEDAWGSSQGWEERMRLEAEAREKQRIAEAKAAGIEPEEERKPDVPTTNGCVHAHSPPLRHPD